MQFSIDNAAKLAEASYKSQNIISPPVMKSCPDKHVQAHLLEGNILLLPGSNSVTDYLKFNLRPLRLGHRQLKMDDNGTEAGASGVVWHQGFLAYSSVIFHWLLSNNIHPRFIIGHSLGAAAAQILSKSYKAPAIAFAGPRPKFTRQRVRNDRKCLLINRGDDPVPRLPSSFSHLATVKLISPAGNGFSIAHSMKHYRSIVDKGLSHGLLPTHWSGG